MSDLFGFGNRSDSAPPFVSTYSQYCVGKRLQIQSGASVATGTVSWTTTNLARFYPLYLPWPYLVRRLWWVNGSGTTSTRDVGVYSPSGTRLVSAGATAPAGASIAQAVDVTDVLLQPGEYWLAFNSGVAANAMCGNTTVATAIHLRHSGVQEMAVGAVALPATATFAQCAQAGIPLCGITWTPSGYA